MPVRIRRRIRRLVLGPIVAVALVLGVTVGVAGAAVYDGAPSSTAPNCNPYFTFSGGTSQLTLQRNAGICTGQLAVLCGVYPNSGTYAWTAWVPTSGQSSGSVDVVIPLNCPAGKNVLNALYRVTDTATSNWEDCHNMNAGVWSGSGATCPP